MTGNGMPGSFPMGGFPGMGGVPGTGGVGGLPAAGNNSEDLKIK